MRCRAIEQMIKEVVEETRIRNIATLHRTMGLPYEQLFDVLEVPETDRQRYLDMLSISDQENEQ